MAKDYETDDGVRIAPLGAIRDFEVAEGYPDIRGWRVDSADGREVGKVHELLIDIDNMRTRYLDVRLTSDIAATPGDRDVLVPVGAAQIQTEGDVIRIPLTAERVGLLPPYDHARLTRMHELEIRRHFSLGEAAAATAAAGTAASLAGRDFYDHDAYDDRRFFSARRRAPVGDASDAARARAAEVRTDARDVRDARELRDARDVHEVRETREELRARNGEIHVPVQRDDAVVLKRGEDGRDEIIIRRPGGSTDERRR